MTDKQRENKPPKSPGRPKGSPNKTTAVLKEAILKAAEEVGYDGEGTEGTVGYLKRVAQEDVKAFTGLLGKVLPMQVVGDKGNPVVTEIIVRGVSANR